MSNYQRFYNKATVERISKLIAEDVANCPECQRGTPVRHTTSYIAENVAVTYQCPSFSRWYNPKLDAMDGRAHCTCDYCW